MQAAELLERARKEANDLIDKAKERLNKSGDAE